MAHVALQPVCLAAASPAAAGLVAAKVQGAGSPSSRSASWFLTCSDEVRACCIGRQIQLPAARQKCCCLLPLLLLLRPLLLRP
jgi:hypothetical protein